MCCRPSRANHLNQQSSFYGPVGHIVDSDDLLGGGPATTFRRFSQRRESATTFRLLACDRLPRFINWFARSEYLREVKAQKQKFYFIKYNTVNKNPQRIVTVAGFVYKIRGEKGLLTLYRCILVESDQGEHFAGFGVDEEVLHEDLWSGGVRGAVLVVVVFFDVVLLCYCFEDSADLDGFAVGAGDTVGLRCCGLNDELQILNILRFALEPEGELGWGEGYDGLGRSFNALECRRVGEGFATVATVTDVLATAHFGCGHSFCGA